MTSHRMRYKIGLTEYNVAIKDIDASGNGGGIPLGTILPYSANSEYPPEGFLWCDGSAVSRAAYPDLFALIGTLYGEGDGVSTFNLPDLDTGEFLEGSSTAGTSKEAGLPNITGHFGNSGNSGFYSDVGSSMTGAFKAGDSFTNMHSGATSGGAIKIAFDASRSSSVYKNDVATVQPKSVTVKYIIKVFSAISTNSELVDVTELSTEITKKADYRTDFVIIYPNGGTEANPANVSTNSRYIEENPFPGYYVNCVAEIQADGNWGDSRWESGTNAYGTMATQFFGNGEIVVQTGSARVFLRTSAETGSPFGTSSESLSSAPCRVKVWKVGKIPQNP